MGPAGGAAVLDQDVPRVRRSGRGARQVARAAAGHLALESARAPRALRQLPCLAAHAPPHDAREAQARRGAVRAALRVPLPHRSLVEHGYDATHCARLHWTCMYCNCNVL